MCLSKIFQNVIHVPSLWLHGDASRKEQGAYGMLCLRTVAIIYYPHPFLGEDWCKKIPGSQTPFEHFPKNAMSRNIAIYIWLKYRAEPEQNSASIPGTQLTWAFLFLMMNPKFNGNEHTLNSHNSVPVGIVESLHFLSITHDIEAGTAFRSWNFKFHGNGIFPAL